MSEITPALTAEEWGAWRIEPASLKGELVIHDDADGLEIVTYDVPGSTIGMAKFKIDQWDRDGIAGTMALANHALPDDDPRKITAADVAAVRVAAHGLHSAAMEYGGLSEREADADREVIAAYRVAAKLSALLPPEP